MTVTKQPRPAAHYIHGEGPNRVVIIPAAVAQRLDADVLNAYRIRHRGGDQDVYNVLVALRTIGLEWEISVTGSDPRKMAEKVAQSPSMSSKQAADAVNMTDRAIRYACKTGRLRATKENDRWRITALDLAHYKTSGSNR